METALTYLEMEGVIVPGGPFYAGSEVRLLRSLDEAAVGMTAEEKEFLKRLFKTGTPGRLWHRFDHAGSAEVLGVSSDRVSRALSDLGRHGTRW